MSGTTIFVLLHRRHVSTYMQVIFRPSITDKSIKCYTCWDPIHVNRGKIHKSIGGLCWSNKVKIYETVFMTLKSVLS